MGMRRVLWGLVSLVGVACSGSTTGNPERDPETLIADFCEKLVGLNCHSDATVAECDAGLHEQRTEAVTHGCSVEFDALIVCFLEKSTACNQSAEDICPAEVNASGACMSSEQECDMGFGGARAGAPSYYQKCDIDCSTWAASCETVSSPTLECTCTKGPVAGKTFLAPTCQEFTKAYATDQCT